MQNLLITNISDSPAETKRALSLIKKALRLEKKYYELSQDDHSLFVQAWLFENTAVTYNKLNQPLKAARALEEGVDLYGDLYQRYQSDPDLSRKVSRQLKKDLFLQAKTWLASGQYKKEAQSFEKLKALIEFEFENDLLDQKTRLALLYIIENALSRLYVNVQELSEAFVHESEATRLQEQIDGKDLYKALSTFLDGDEEAFLQRSEAYLDKRDSLFNYIDDISQNVSESEDESRQMAAFLSLTSEYPKISGRLEKEMSPLLESDPALFETKMEKKLELAQAEADNPEREADVIALAGYCMNVAEYFLKQENEAQFIAWAIRAIELLEKAEKTLPDNYGAILRKNILVMMYARLAPVLDQADQTEQAISYCQKGIDLALKLQKKNQLSEKEVLPELEQMLKEFQA